MALTSASSSPFLRTNSALDFTGQICREEVGWTFIRRFLSPFHSFRSVRASRKTDSLELTVAMAVATPSKQKRDSQHHGKVVTREEQAEEEVPPSLSSFVSRSCCWQEPIVRGTLPTLVLMRHGESMWNNLKLFTGDVDIPLTERGVMDALAGGKALADVDFDMIFTSRLMRSKQTALLAMTQNNHKVVPVVVRGGYYGHGHPGDDNRLRLRHAAAQALRQAACRTIPVYADKALNERCFGVLQGLDKEAAIAEFGHERVELWWRTHDKRPPQGESLIDTWERALRFFKETVEPRMKEGKNVLVVSHGNVLRSILSHICGLSRVEMLQLRVLTSRPYVFTHDGTSFTYCRERGHLSRSREGATSSSLAPSLKPLPLGIATYLMPEESDAWM
eukprot:TRINITY_DN4408_c0_g1_i1.p1 TRINITY_DN4408_c0_g1~~TRINITY_DN4408_c0_g1_i1.p1  ORF type:complete len:391 (+),score=62.83 TRINITY_DN4408_c0_g1_i1:220-1392(+)